MPIGLNFLAALSAITRFLSSSNRLRSSSSCGGGEGVDRRP